MRVKIDIDLIKSYLKNNTVKNVVYKGNSLSSLVVDGERIWYSIVAPVIVAVLGENDVRAVQVTVTNKNSVDLTATIDVTFYYGNRYEKASKNISVPANSNATTTIVITDSTAFDDASVSVYFTNDTSAKANVIIEGVGAPEESSTTT